MSAIFLSLAITFEVAATLALKAVSARNKAWIVLVVIGYPASFVMLAFALREGMTIGIAYGIWTACGLALTSIFGFLIFKEKLHPLTYAGIAIIAIGVFLVEAGVGT
jgi:small multidrug resistance pump